MKQRFKNFLELTDASYMKKLICLVIFPLSLNLIAAPIKSKPVNVTVKPQQQVYQSLLTAAQGLKPGEWYQLPAKNKISDVFPPKDGGNWYASGYFPQNVVNAWDGGEVAEGKLFIWGGGHNDYGGNEVYTFDLETWIWTRVTNPSHYKTYPCGYSEPAGDCVTVDGTPASVHSYQGITYMPKKSQFWVGGGAVYSTAGGFTSQSAMFNMTTKAWTKLPNMPKSGSIISAWDAVSEKVLIVTAASSADSGSFYTYNPATNSYENLSKPNWSISGTGDFDPVNRKFILFDNTQPNKIQVFDFSGIDLKQSAGVNWDRFGYQLTKMNGVDFRPNLDVSTGIAYVPDQKLFAFWDGNSSDVWTLDPLTWNWSKVNVINQGPPPSPDSKGVYSRWRYLPQYKIFLAYDNVSSNPWIFKLP